MDMLWQLGGIDLNILVRDLTDTNHYPAGLVDTYSSESDERVRIDNDGRPIISLETFEPKHWTNHDKLQNLQVRVPSGGGHGSRVWPAVPLLCTYLQQVFGDGNAIEDASSEVTGWRLLELGAGIGLCGICAAAMSPNLHVTITDGDATILRLAQKNMELNAERYVSEPVIKALDWDSLGANMAEAATFQVVMGSDIVYEGVNNVTLWEAVDWALDATPGAQFLLSHTRKCEEVQEDQWLIAFRAYGESSGFVLVYQHCSDSVYLDVWARRAVQ